MLNYFKKLMREFPKLQLLPRAILDLHDISLAQVRTLKVRNSRNRFNDYGKKFFSQSDEDGLTLEILNRLQLQNGKFLEFGVANGLENNSIILLASGWKGVWVGGTKLAFEQDHDWKTFNFIKTWVTLENLKQICEKTTDFLGGRPNLISMDLDGNDLIFIEEILNNGLEPEVFIVEYNAKFPLPIKFSVKYDHFHKWGHDDYFGSSLASFIELFEKFSYFLVCVNGSTGVNAFFVKKTFAQLFPEVPESDLDKWIEPSYALDRNFLHKTSPKTLRAIISDNEERHQ